LKDLLVMKFGGTSVGSAGRMRAAARLAIAERQKRPVAVVVSAMSKITDLLLDTKLDSEQREFVDTLIHSSESLLTILNDVLDYSKIEAGLLNLEAIDFDLEEQLERAMFLQSEPAKKKGKRKAATTAKPKPVSAKGKSSRSKPKNAVKPRLM